MRTKMVVSSLAALLIVLAALTAVAAPDQVLVRQVLAGGGGQIGDGATLLLANTIGEPGVSGPVVVGSIGEAAGFWQGMNTDNRIFLPSIARAP